MNSSSVTQADVDQLNQEYKRYIDGIRREWQDRNRIHSRNVYEVMTPHEREEVHARINQWKVYVTPLAEAWWRERGFKVIWPEDDKDPIKLVLLEDT